MGFKFSTLGLVGATFGAAALMTSAQASPTPPEDLNSTMQAESYADLLAPIDNAIALLRTAEMSNSADEASNDGATIQLAWHHHHHHYHHHHHHHHHHRHQM
jgi:hypothetical protein